MRDDPITQLHAILGMFRHKSPLLIPESLSRLRDIFPDSAPKLFIYPIRGRRPAQQLSPLGASNFRTNSDGPSPLRSDFDQGAPLSRNGILYLPFSTKVQPEGFLSLHMEAPDQIVLSALFALTQLMAAELRSQEVRQLAAEHLHLADLDQTLSEATDVDQLLSTAAQQLLRHRIGFCVIVRRLHNGTLLSPPTPFITSQNSRLATHCLLLEHRLALSVVSSNKPRSRQIKPPSGHQDQTWQQFVLPLNRGEKTYGCLTIFFQSSTDIAMPRLRLQLTRICSKLGEGLERLALGARLEALTRDYSYRQEESSTLFRISRALHAIPRMNELMHFILAAATAHDGGGFDRSMVFLANKKSDTLQGMLGLTRETGELSLPPALGLQVWENPLLGEDVQSQQRQSSFCRAVMNQRLPLDGDTPIARAFLRNRIVLVSRPGFESPDAILFANDLALGPYACAPLTGGNRVLGVLVVDNAFTQMEITTDRLRFLEIFSNLAGAALENALLVRQLENAYHDLQEAQDRLLHGERLALLGEMAATVAHELKTPLVSIGGFAQRLARSAQSPEQSEYASIIVREIERMETLLTGVLSFSKKHLLCFGLCDINQLIEKTVQLEETSFNESGITITFHLAPDLPQIHGDEHKLMQVLLNLLTNARQAMPSGGTLSIRSRTGLFAGKKCVTVEVEDSGGGIPHHLLRQIFDPFFSTKDEGTGLGLPITAQIIEQHRGEIEVFNRGQGAVFVIHLPLV